MSRPEVQAPPEIFYNDVEARKYTSSSRIIEIQAKLSERAVELLALPDDGVPRLLLDIGSISETHIEPDPQRVVPNLSGLHACDRPHRHRFFLHGYAWEITTVEGGYGLDELLSSRKCVLTEIQNTQASPQGQSDSNLTQGFMTLKFC